MKNKVFVRIFTKIERLEDKKALDIKKCEDIIAENEKKIHEAAEHITVNTDIDDFLNASEKRAKAENAIKACNEKIHLLKTEGLISEEEYDADVKAIRSEQKRLADETFKSIVPMMLQMFKLFEDMDADIKKFNDLIRDEAAVAMHDLGPTKQVLYNGDEKYDLMKNYIGRLQYQMEHHLTLSDYFKKN